MSVRSNEALMMSMGVHQMWGFSPSFDFLKDLYENESWKAKNSRQEDKESLNILLFSPGDIRHVIHGISTHLRHKPVRPVHFYVHEKQLEVLARHLLLLQVVHDWELSLTQRCNLFLEIYGNALVQERTSKYIAEKAKQLIELVYDEKGFMADLFDLEHLKMKHRDELVDIFESWRAQGDCNLKTLREHRLRHLHETRYDCRQNVSDWDYTMKLKTVEGAGIIHYKQYKHWRETGVAFEFGDQTYTMGNKTMLSFAETKERGVGSRLRRGFWLDIIVSPYISFGLDCYKSNKYAENLFQIYNKGSGAEQQRHNTVEVCAFNILSYLHEIETGSIYEMTKDHQVYSGIGEDGSGAKIEEVVDDQQEQEPNQNAMNRVAKIMETLKDVKITLLTGSPKDFLHKKRYAKLFDYVFFSTQSAHLLDTDSIEDGKGRISDILKDEALLALESSIYLVPLKNEQKIAYMNKILELAHKMSVKPLVELDNESVCAKDLTDASKAVFKFQFQRV